MISTISHIKDDNIVLHSIDQQLQEKADEYNIPHCFALVDYEKAFDSIEFNPLFEAIENQLVEATYLSLLRDIYNGVTSTVEPRFTVTSLNQSPLHCGHPGSVPNDFP